MTRAEQISEYQQPALQAAKLATMFDRGPYWVAGYIEAALDFAEIHEAPKDYHEGYADFTYYQERTDV